MLLDLVDLLYQTGRHKEAEQALREFGGIASRIARPGVVASALVIESRMHLDRGQSDSLSSAIRAYKLVRDQIVNDDTLYVWQSLGEIYRRHRLYAKALEAMGIMLPGALEANYQHYAGRALCEIARCCDESGMSRHV